MDSTALLSYLQRSFVLALSAGITAQGAKVIVSDEYIITVLIDALERIFLYERKSKLFGEIHSWDVFEKLEQAHWARDHIRRIETDFEIEERGRAFLKVCLKNGWLNDLCTTLTNSEELLEDLYEETAILRKPDDLSIFTHLLTSLEQVQFNIQLSSNMTQQLGVQRTKTTIISPATETPPPRQTSTTSKKKKKLRIVSIDESTDAYSDDVNYVATTILQKETAPPSIESPAELPPSSSSGVADSVEVTHTEISSSKVPFEVKDEQITKDNNVESKQSESEPSRSTMASKLEDSNKTPITSVSTTVHSYEPATRTSEVPTSHREHAGASSEGATTRSEPTVLFGQSVPTTLWGQPASTSTEERSWTQPSTRRYPSGRDGAAMYSSSYAPPSSMPISIKRRQNTSPGTSPKSSYSPSESRLEDSGFILPFDIVNTTSTGSYASTPVIGRMPSFTRAAAKKSGHRVISFGDPV